MKVSLRKLTPSTQVTNLTPSLPNQSLSINPTPSTRRRPLPLRPISSPVLPLTRPLPLPTISAQKSQPALDPTRVVVCFVWHSSLIFGLTRALLVYVIYPGHLWKRHQRHRP